MSLSKNQKSQYSTKCGVAYATIYQLNGELKNFLENNTKDVAAP